MVANIFFWIFVEVSFRCVKQVQHIPEERTVHRQVTSTNAGENLKTNQTKLNQPTDNQPTRQYTDTALLCVYTNIKLK